MHWCFHWGLNPTHMKQHKAQFHVSPKWGLLPRYFYLRTDQVYKVTTKHPYIMASSKLQDREGCDSPPKHTITAFV